jgi:hypothetical protein|tara:strand:- start:428 stop:622 length:195 start_codon:yes stop_codon:yes gene_type:complete
MKDSPFVHESWSSNRVPELIQNMHRVPIEYQNQFPESVLGIAIGTLPLSLVIRQSKKKGDLNVQ